jgi:hypothetical protein
LASSVSGSIAAARAWLSASRLVSVNVVALRIAVRSAAAA